MNCDVFNFFRWSRARRSGFGVEEGEKDQTAKCSGKVMIVVFKWKKKGNYVEKLDNETERHQMLELDTSYELAVLSFGQCATLKVSWKTLLCIYFLLNPTLVGFYVFHCFLNHSVQICHCLATIFLSENSYRVPLFHFFWLYYTLKDALWRVSWQW